MHDNTPLISKKNEMRLMVPDLNLVLESDKASGTVVKENTFLEQSIEITTLKIYAFIIYQYHTGLGESEWWLLISARWKRGRARVSQKKKTPYLLSRIFQEGG